MTFQKTGTADYKAPGGKLVRVRMVEDSGIINRVQITGDFFLLPEDSLARLEQALIGTVIDQLAVRKVVDDFFVETGAQGLGVTIEDFVKAVFSTREANKES